MIYLDNAATTWPKPPCVRDAVFRAFDRFGANPGRGSHRMSAAAAAAVYRCRETAAELFGISDPACVVFTANCTMALNTVIKGLLRRGGRMIISDLEHNAVVRPAHALSPGNPVYDIAAVAPGDDDQTVANFRRLITPQTRAIVCMHASNVFGTVLPVARLAALASEHGLAMAVDAAQTAGMLPVHMTQMGIDFLCVPGHKGLYGPPGTGMLLCRPDSKFRLDPLCEGGTGSQSISPNQPEELPDRLESGTLNTPGICGLRAGMEWLMRQDFKAMGEEKLFRMAAFYDRLANSGRFSLYTPAPVYGQTAPVLSVNLPLMTSEQTAAALDQHGVAVRAGLHCAPMAHRHFGTLPGGTVRFSPSGFTTAAQYEETLRILLKIAGKGYANAD